MLPRQPHWAEAEDFDEDLFWTVFELEGRLKQVILWNLRLSDDGKSVLSMRELFLSTRADRLSSEAHEIWQTICALDPELSNEF